jgi:hypothetical protein
MKDGNLTVLYTKEARDTERVRHERRRQEYGEVSLARQDSLAS